MPVITGRLKRIVKSKNSFLERHLEHVISIIRSGVANSDAFESIAEQLKKGRLEELMVADVKNSSEDTEMVPAVDADNNESNFDLSDESAVAPTVVTNVGTASYCTGTTGLADKEILSNGGQQQVAKATVQVLKRLTAFGALLGKPSSGAPTVIKNVGTAYCTGNVTSRASLGNLQLENISSETKCSGTLSGTTGLADKEILSNGGQQQMADRCCLSERRGHYSQSKGPFDLKLMVGLQGLIKK